MTAPALHSLSVTPTLPPNPTIVVLSDTHVPRMAKQLPGPLTRMLSTAHLILHAGDFVTLAAVEQLEGFAPVIGVAGNNDDDGIRARFPARQLINLCGVRVGLVHGHDGRGRSTAERALAAFAGEEVDVLVFGHSHIPLLERRGDILLFNPGSPTDKRRQPRFSYGLLELGADLRAKHGFFDRE